MKNSPEGRKIRSKRCYSQRKAYLQTWKSERGCTICGEKDYACLDFHHPDRSKKNEKLIKDASGKKAKTWYGLSWAEFTAELKVVIVLCANCHRKLHRNEVEGGKI